MGLNNIYGTDKYKQGNQSGGSMLQTAIYPEAASYSERDFIWHLSISDIEEEESALAVLPDYSRCIMVIDGDVVMSCESSSFKRIMPFQSEEFDGGLKIKCFGKYKSYNLLVRKDCHSRVTYVEANSKAQNLDNMESEDYNMKAYTFYCIKGYVILSVNGEDMMIKEGQQFVAVVSADEASRISIMGEGAVIEAQICYNDVEEIEIVKKITLEDYKIALRLYISRNKWNQAIKRGKGIEDEVSTVFADKIKFIEKSYITFIVWITVIMLMLIGTVAGASVIVMVSAMIIWTVLFLFLVAPMIYAVILPKPIARHIIQSGASSESPVNYEEQLMRDLRYGKMMKKYKRKQEDKEAK